MKLRLVVLALTLAAFLARGVLYLFIGSWLPAVFAAAVTLAILGAHAVGPGTGRLAVRLWGGLLILYGVGRIGLAALLFFAPVGSPHALENTGLIFVLVSALYLAAGVVLVRRQWGCRKRTLLRDPRPAFQPGGRRL